MADFLLVASVTSGNFSVTLEALTYSKKGRVVSLKKGENIFIFLPPPRKYFSRKSLAESVGLIRIIKLNRI